PSWRATCFSARPSTCGPGSAHSSSSPPPFTSPGERHSSPVIGSASKSRTLPTPEPRPVESSFVRRERQHLARLPTWQCGNRRTLARLILVKHRPAAGLYGFAKLPLG